MKINGIGTASDLSGTQIFPLKEDKMMRLIVALAATLVVISSIFLHTASFLRSMPQNTDKSDGAILGRVLDAEGKPIINATVTAEMANAIGGIPKALTNKDGEFIIRGLRPGQYTLHARKEEDGYPRTEFNLYDAGTGADPQVEVLEHQVMQNVILQLGLKSGILTIRVVDANSNQPLHHADITIRRVDLPDRYLSSGLSVEEGEFKILVPSLPFTVKVSVKGYEDWYYKIAGEGNKASALLMAPNSRKKLLVALHPVGRSN